MGRTVVVLWISFPIGFAVDIAIDKLKIFGDTLDLYYEIAGAGFWGAAVLLLLLVMVYKYLVPVL